MIETEEDIGKGIVDLIAQRGITELVMGAAADKHYSRYASIAYSCKNPLILSAM